MTDINFLPITPPSRRQPWSKNAKQALSGYTFPKTVSIVPGTKDRYGRTVATVFADGVNVNKAMVRDGHCWTYRKYVRDEAFFDLESEARDAKRGLWSLPEADRVPPWEWRRAR